MAVGSQRLRLERIRRGETGHAREPAADRVAVEEPLEFRVAAGDGPPVSVMTMRTPGHDVDLLLGWLVGEGIVDDVDLLRQVTGRSSGEGLQRAASVQVRLPAGSAVPGGRPLPVSSACGVCGADSVASMLAQARWPLMEDRSTVAADVLLRLPNLLVERQATFARTGGLHAAGAFRADGTPVVVREDVGRHNAVDKVIGHALRQRLLPLRGHVLQVSGRASTELVHKAIAAGFPVLSAVSAPSSLAVTLAQEAGLTLVGFVRGDRLNVYTHGERIT